MSAVDRHGVRQGRHSAPPQQHPGPGRRERWASRQVAAYSLAALVLTLAVRILIGSASPAIMALMLALGVAVVAAALACRSAVVAADHRAAAALASATTARHGAERRIAEAERKIAEAALTGEQFRQEAAETKFLLGQICSRQVTRIGVLLLATRELQETEDPKLLESLYAVEHLIIELKRLAQDGGVVTGREPVHQWTEALKARRVARLGAQQIQAYQRVEFLPGPADKIAGRAVHDVVGVIAALLDNATACSSPDSKVAIGARREAAAGQEPVLVIEITDQGLGIAHADALRTYNEALADPYGPAARELLSRGHMGLVLAGRRAVRHRIAVRLEPNDGAGTRAVIRVPADLLVDGAPAQAPSAWDVAGTQAWPTPAARPAPIVAPTAAAFPGRGNAAERPAPAAAVADGATGVAGARTGGGQVHVDGLPPLPTRSRPPAGAQGVSPPAPAPEMPIVSAAAAASFWGPRPASQPDLYQDQELKS